METQNIRVAHGASIAQERRFPLSHFHTMTYIGRFAPSPTGRLHLGSLVGALASYLDARASGGRWLVRMEDLDPPREEPGAAGAILQCLEQHGLLWDGEVMWQGQRQPRYQQVLDDLCSQGKAFYCTCSRTDLAPYAGIYPGTCRDQLAAPDGEYAVRLRVPDSEIAFEDRVQGHFAQNLQREVGDFVLRRKDGLFAYQLAVVVDDADQGVTHIVRGSDLLDSTPRQLWLQTQLGASQPSYAHVPVVTNAEGQKLSKQTFAPVLQAADAKLNLCTALAFLGQASPPRHYPLADVLRWAVEHWSLQRVPRRMQIQHS